MRNAVFCIFMAFASCAPLSSVIIVAHGTFAANETWHRSDGDFVRALRSSFKYLPDSCPQKNAAVVSFRWTGHNNAHARVVAARDLGNLIMSYPDNEPIFFIGHSHAGNVFALLTKLLKNPLIDQNIPSSSEAGCLPVRSLSASGECDWDSIVGLPCDETVRATIAESMKYFTLKYQNKILTRCCGLEGFSHKPVSFQKKINIAYFLGTPVDTSAYLCDMRVVDRCYALHSSADLIQTVGGCYGRIFPSCKRLLNLKTVILTPGHKVLGLGHSHLRGHAVGAALLIIPSIVEETMGLSAESFDEYSQMILVLFADGGQPVVVDSLRESDGKFHRFIQDRLNSYKKNSPTSEAEAGGNFIQFQYGYSANMSL